jgi:hypothetical protein
MKNPWTRKIDRKGKIPLQKKIEFTSWIVFGLFLLLSSVLASANFTLGILAGGLISILNFYGLHRGLQEFIGQIGSNDAGKALLLFKYLLRLAITGIFLYIIITKTTADIFGLVIGLSTVVVSIVLTVIKTIIDKSYLEEV